MVEDQYRGQVGRCVACDGPIEVPAFSIASTGPAISRSRPLAWALASLVAIVVAAVAVVVTIQYGGSTLAQMQASAERVGSMRNLEKIASALNAYAADHGVYPPAVLNDATGKPLHSWRVLILPYLGEENLFNEFRLDQPWESSENQYAAQGHCPQVFQHPNSQSMGLSEASSYYLVTGADTLFPADKSLAPKDVQDSAAQTLLVAEGNPSVSSGLWTQPIDIDFMLMRGDIANPGPNEIGGWVEGGAAVACVDGRSRFVKDSTPPLIVRALVTPSGQEPLADDALD